MKMLLSNNNNEYSIQPAVHRRPKNERRRDKGMAASSSARNSWSFSVEPVMSQHQHQQTVLLQQQHQFQPLQCANQEGYYLDAEGLYSKLQQPIAEAKPQSVSRSRLRQRSTSNLAASGLRSRDQSASGKQGTVSKGVDYIRVNQPTLRVATGTPTSDQSTEIQDRSEYGNPDGSSAHSTAEREGVTAVKSSETPPPMHPADLCQVINQNQSNDFKSKRATPPLIVPPPEETKTAASVASPTAGDGAPLTVRLGSGRGSARFTSKSTETSGRKSTGQSAAVKTEWTFLPSPAAPAAVSEAENHETSHNMKPEESSLVRKGLLWVMRDRLFSRWHERYCILTHNYLHCFKKGSDANQLTQMGNFLFKVNLAEVTTVQWLDKRGTAIVCLSLAKEGRLLVKTSHDLNGWYQDFQSCVKDTRGRRQTLLERGNNKNGPDMVPIITTATSSSSSSNGGQRRPGPQSGTVIQPVVLREKANGTGSAKCRQVNRYSLMSDVELKLNSSTDKNDIQLIATEQHQSLLNNGMPAPPPVPIPYRERSVSFDRSRASCKAEREVKRRSYYPNHVTQV